MFKEDYSIREEKINHEVTRIFEEYGTAAKIKKDTMMYTPEDYVDRIYLIKKGLVELFIMGIDGRKKTLMILEPGHLIGLLPSLDGGTNAIYIKAMEDLDTIYIKNNCLDDILDKHPTLMKHFTKLVCGTTRAFKTQMEQLCFEDANRRVCSILLQVVDIYGKSKENKNSVEIYFPISQNFISDLAGISRSSTVRVLNELKENNILEVFNGKYIIKDTDKLTSLIE